MIFYSEIICFQYSLPFYMRFLCVTSFSLFYTLWLLFFSLPSFFELIHFYRQLKQPYMHKHTHSFSLYMASCMRTIWFMIFFLKIELLWISKGVHVHMRPYYASLKRRCHELPCKTHFPIGLEYFFMGVCVCVCVCL